MSQRDPARSSARAERKALKAGRRRAEQREPATADWPIEDEQAFVAGFPRVKRVAGSRVTLDPSAWPPATEVWVLTPPGG